MKKILLLIIMISSMLFSAIRSQIPLPASQLSTDNNGLKNAIEAYRDGVGIYTVKAQNGEDLDNKEMNSLVFKYGEVAGDSNISLKEYVLEHGNNSEKESASKLGKFEPFVPLAGSSCDDNNIKTINDRYVDGVCVGVDVEGKVCNDSNIQTINDIYVNGFCYGINVENQTCDDNNIETINDKYTDGICSGINVEGLDCDDNNIQTISDKYMNGVCFGIDVEGLACDDSNVKTINDKYTNGICIGTNVEGQTCNDNNVQTINDKYTDGICVGTNVEGQTCSDNNAQTINDKYVSGICIGTNVEGQTCNDNNTQTTNDKYKNGVCLGDMLYSSCLEILSNGKSTGNGTYIVDADGTGPDSYFEVYCDMTTNGGGWTLVFGLGTEYGKNHSIWNGVATNDGKSSTYKGLSFSSLNSSKVLKNIKFNSLMFEGRSFGKFEHYSSTFSTFANKKANKTAINGLTWDFTCSGGYTDCTYVIGKNTGATVYHGDVMSIGIGLDAKTSERGTYFGTQFIHSNRTNICNRPQNGNPDGEWCLTNENVRFSSSIGKTQHRVADGNEFVGLFVK